MGGLSNQLCYDRQMQKCAYQEIRYIWLYIRFRVGSDDVLQRHLIGNNLEFSPFSSPSGNAR